MSDEDYAYLREGFNPRNLRKDQLRNILLTHNVDYDNDMLKGRLMELYNEHIVPRRAELRAEFLDVPASATNIENATPPAKARVSRFEQPSEEPDTSESPRARRARSRSPRRARSPARQKATAAAGNPPLELKDSAAPDLAPPSSKDVILEPPKSPKSPQRRRANRKVDVSEPEPEALSVSTEEIKVKVPRSPRKKRRHEDDQDGDESFTSNNVFQSGKPTKKRRSAEEARPGSTGNSSHVLLEPENKGEELRSYRPDVSKLEFDEYVDFSGSPESILPPPPVTEADIGVDALPLHPDFVADLNAEVERLEDSSLSAQFVPGPALILNRNEAQSIEPPLAERLVEDDEPLQQKPKPASKQTPKQASKAAGVQKQAAKPSPKQAAQQAAQQALQQAIQQGALESPQEDSKPAAKQSLNKAPKRAPKQAAKQTVKQAVKQESVPSTDGAPRKESDPIEARSGQSPLSAQSPLPGSSSVKQESSVPREPSVEATRAQQRADAPRRRGFVPSLRELSVSRAFAEQMEPFLVPSPNPTPRSSLAPEPIPRSGSGGSSRQLSPDSDSGVELPDATEVAASDLHSVIEHAASETARHSLPRLPRPHIPRVRLPRVHLPRIPRPQIPRPRALLPRVPLSLVKKAAYKASILSSLVLSTALITLLVLFAKWYYDAWAQAEFCGVGARKLRIYPDWTTHNTGFEVATTFQAQFREMMDEVWPDCVSCPEHAHCYPNRILLCDSGYREAAHPLSHFGLPLPPRCLPDWETQRKLDVLSERAAQLLREKRATVLCDTPEVKDSEVEHASALSVQSLKSRLFDEKSALLSDDEFETLWQQVLEQLPEKHADVYVVSSFPRGATGDAVRAEVALEGNIFNDAGQLLTNDQNPITRDAAGGADAAAPSALDKDDALAQEGVRLASSSDSQLSLRCRFRRSTTLWLRKHRTEVGFAAILATTLGFAVSALARSRAGRLRKKQVVEDFVSLLKRQRELADADTDGNIKPYLQSSDLRARAPKDQFKIIQHNLESVEGVRMRQVEIYGEITRIWEWAP